MSREARSDSPFVDFAAGSTILHEGEIANALYIIEAGKVAIERPGSPAVVLAELGPGDFFGEMSILQEQPHSANAVARTAVRALKIDSAAFHAVLRENVEVAVHMMRRMVVRLRGGEQRRLELEAQVAGGGGAARSAAPTPDAAVTRDVPPVAAPKAVDAPVAKPAPLASPAPTPAAAPARVASPAPNAPAAPAARAAPAPAVPAPVSAPAAPPPAKPIPAPAPLAAAAVPATAPAASGPSTQRAFVLRHADGAIALPAGKPECLVGRPDPATGAIPEINLGPLDLARSLSRRHARLLVAANGVSVREEPGVANGTWVNGERLAPGQTVALKPGDKLRFGAIELEFGAA